MQSILHNKNDTPVKVKKVIVWSKLLSKSLICLEGSCTISGFNHWWVQHLGVLPGDTVWSEVAHWAVTWRVHSCHWFLSSVLGWATPFCDVMSAQKPTNHELNLGGKISVSSYTFSASVPVTGKGLIKKYRYSPICHI